MKSAEEKRVALEDRVAKARAKVDALGDVGPIRSAVARLREHQARREAQ